MNIFTVLYMISILTSYIGFAMFGCVPVGWLMNDSPSTLAEFSFCAAAAVAVGFTGILLTRKRRGKAGKTGVREGFATVAFGWLAALLFGSLPFQILVGLSTLLATIGAVLPVT